MSFIHAILLGTIQGLTEFLPVSSSGHLVIFQHFLGFKGPDLIFDTFLHLGTLTAVCITFRGDLSRMGQALLRRDLSSPDGHVFLLILIGTVPTVLMGLALRDSIEKLFSAVVPTALALLVTGCLLFVADRVRSKRVSPKEMRRIDAFLIGLVQGLSLVPGLSRSGSTISTGIFAGVDRNRAARFSFLLSIPAIAGAGILQAPEVKGLDGCLALPVVVGTLSAALTGSVAIRILLRIVARRRLTFFSFYCWLLGLGVLLLS